MKGDKKICPKCKIFKSAEGFYYEKRRDRLQSWCKMCVAAGDARRLRENPEKIQARKKDYYAKNRMRILLKQTRDIAKKHGHIACSATVEELEASTTGYCEVCGVSEIELRGKLCMDHCHKTGKFRGWLCRKCNLALGYVNDSPERLLALTDYLNTKGA